MGAFIKNLGGKSAILPRILFIIFAVTMTSTSIASAKIEKIPEAEPITSEVVTEELTTIEETTEETTEEVTENNSLTLSVSSLQNDIRIRVYDSNKNVFKSVTFDLKITDPSGNVTEQQITGFLKLTDIAAGKYTVEITPQEPYTFAKTKKTVTVKDTVEKKVVDVEVSKGTAESEDVKEEEAVILVDTVDYVESTSTVVKTWVEVPFADIKDPYADKTATLCDTDKNELYIKDGEETYKLATNGDYDAKTTFYKKVVDETGDEPVTTYEAVAAEKVKDPNASVKLTDKLLDNTGVQVSLKNGEVYTAATVADYSKDAKYYKEVEETLYTGWQTINGNHYYYKADNTYVTGVQVIQGVSYNFSDTGKLMGKLGADVSYHNGKVNFKTMKAAGVEFVIIRCAYRGYKYGNITEDTRFQENYKAAKEAGLQIGLYFYSTALTEAEAVEEASTCIQLLKGEKIDFPIFFDFEGYSQEKYRTYGTTKEQRTACALAFCETIESAGYKAGVYGSKYYMTPGTNAKFDITKFEGKYCIWIAQYNSKITYTRHYDMWQNTSTADGKTYGVSSTYIDLNYSYM